jgi:hypothetical protein
VFTYGLLLAPWPGWNAMYGRFFRTIGATVLAHEDGRMVVRFRSAVNPPRPEVDSEIVLADRAQIDSGCRAPARILCLDTRAVGWIPSALLFALVIASPVSWPRRWRALCWGAFFGHVYLLGVVSVFLWNQSSGTVPVSLLPFSPCLGDGLEETFVTQTGASLAIPVLIWLAATFRSDDATLLFGAAGAVRASRVAPHVGSAGPADTHDPGELNPSNRRGPPSEACASKF